MLPLCSGRTLARDAGAGANRMLCMTGCAIPAPVVMTLAAPALLDCHVSTATGEVQLRSTSKRSTSKRSKAVQLHFRANISSIPAQALLASPLPASEASEQQPAVGDSSLESSTLEAAAEAASTEPAAPGTPPPVQPAGTSRLAALLGVSEAAAAAGAASGRGIRCSAEVTLEQQGRGSGWVAHPAVTDNALQLGPATGDVGKEDDADVTRVVAGMAAYVAAEQASLIVFDCLHNCFEVGVIVVRTVPPKAAVW